MLKEWGYEHIYSMEKNEKRYKENWEPKISLIWLSILRWESYCKWFSDSDWSWVELFSLRITFWPDGLSSRKVTKGHFTKILTHRFSPENELYLSKKFDELQGTGSRSGFKNEMLDQAPSTTPSTRTNNRILSSKIRIISPKLGPKSEIGRYHHYNNRF